MKKITIGFSKPKNKFFPIFSWLIRWYEGLPFSHSYIRWETKYGCSICYHAAANSLHFLSDSLFEKGITVVEKFELDLSDEQFAILMKYCLSTCGQSYGLAEVFGVAIAQKLNLPKNPFGEGEQRQFCAELVYRALNLANGEKLTGDGDSISLKNVYLFVKDLAGKNAS